MLITSIRVNICKFYNSKLIIREYFQHKVSSKIVTKLFILIKKTSFL